MAAEAKVVISEVMAGGGNPLVDADRDRSDWIELFNSGDSPVSLKDWILVDSGGLERGWRLPDILMNSGAYLVIFASGKDCREPLEELHTNFRLNRSGEPLELLNAEGASQSKFAPELPEQYDGLSYGLAMETTVTPVLDAETPLRYRLPTSEDQESGWQQPGFDDLAWEPGQGALGYDETPTLAFGAHIDTDIGDIISGRSASVYVRYSFQVADADQTLRVRMRYDDGLILYLNGEPVFEDNLPSRLTYRSRAVEERSVAAALSPELVFLGRADGLREGENVLAAQVLNIRSRDTEMLLSMQADVVAAVGTELGDPQYFSEPTPGVPNVGGRPTVATPPEASVSAGLYEGPIEVALLHPSPESQVRYSLDGSIPGQGASLYTEPLNISSSTILRARAYTPGAEGSSVTTWRYTMGSADLLSFESNLPVVVVDTFGQRISPAVSTRTVIQIFDHEEGERTRLDRAPVLSEESSIKVRGSSTEGRPKRAFTLELQDAYGEDLDREVLGMPAESDWILYAPYNFDRALIRNTFIYEVSNQIGMYAVRTRFCEMFVNDRNGESLSDASYVGVYVLMEKIKRGADRVPVEKLLSKHVAEPDITGGYILKIDRLDPGDVGFGGGGQTLAHVYPKEEDRTPAQLDFLRDYMSAFDRAMSAAIRSDEPADGLKHYTEYIDFNSFVDFHMLNEFTKNPDGLRLSTYMHIPREGKLTMGPIWDFDRTMGPDDDGRAASPIGRSSVYSSGWWAKLFRIPEFRQAYTDRWHLWRQTVMSESNLLGIIDSMAEELEEAQERNFAKWRLVNGNEGWRRELAQLKSWVSRRLEWFDGESVAQPNPSVGGGIVETGTTISFSGEEVQFYVTTDGADPRMPGGNVAPSAKILLPDENLVIEKSLMVSARARMEGRREVLWSPLFRGVYLVGEVPELVVSEIMYHPAEPSGSSVWGEEDFEYVELRSSATEVQDLVGLRVSDGIEYEMMPRTLQPGAGLLIVNNREAFLERYPASAAFVVGEFRGNLSNRGETILVEDIFGRVVTQVSYEDRGDWAAAADGDGYSLEYLDGVEHQDNPMSWVVSEELGGSPVGESLVRISRVEIVEGDVVLSIVGLQVGEALIQRATGIGTSDWQTIHEFESEGTESEIRLSGELRADAAFYRILIP